jgi:hypothetical protein
MGKEVTGVFQADWYEGFGDSRLRGNDNATLRVPKIIKKASFVQYSYGFVR